MTELKFPMLENLSATELIILRHSFKNSPRLDQSDKDCLEEIEKLLKESVLQNTEEN